MISAVNVRDEMRFTLTEKAVTARVFVGFRRRLITGAPAPVFLIVDGHPSHRGSLVERFLQEHEGQIRLFYLPAYSPELNPDEQVWREVQAHGPGREAVSGKQELKRQLLRALKKLQRTPEKIRAFFRTPEAA
ncbi:MAG: hypothetical protein KatS3mg082_2867 [Nitrospiraceae bacterium]|nr:MAG: hypothetical protein KatS3mg082_2867 [Nitrospiraceae bacterium]